MKIEHLLGSISSEIGDEVVEALLRRSHSKIATALKRIRRPEAAVGVVKSSLGDLLVAMGPSGVALTHYVHDNRDIAATLATLRLQFDPVEDQQTVREVGKEVSRYVAGDANALRQRVDLTLAGNAFQKKVLDGLQTVPRGALVSYQALGVMVGSAKAARAIGNALHNNPVPIYIPCHRVIASDGRIGGYVGGAACKLQLLRSEGFAVDDETASISRTTVWGHRGTNMYCKPDCRTAAHVDRARIVFFANSKEARRAGMWPCKLCQLSRRK
jgi:methylated-DNA-[protein]-cysteine S-methyltransferase